MRTERLDVPFFVKSRAELEKSYPKGGTGRHRLEGQVGFLEKGGGLHQMDRMYVTLVLPGHVSGLRVRRFVRCTSK